MWQHGFNGNGVANEDWQLACSVAATVAKTGVLAA